MNYQKVVCWGDSQTFGARTYGCYPLHLVAELERTTRYRWSAVNLSTNGHTARDLWFRLTLEAPKLVDYYKACILIGANDVTGATPLDLFELYLRQALATLEICGWRVIHLGEIPPIWSDGHAFAEKAAESRREFYNDVIERAAADCPIARMVRFPDLSALDFVDPLHFSESGNRLIASAFANSIQSF